MAARRIAASKIWAKQQQAGTWSCASGFTRTPPTAVIHAYIGCHIAVFEWLVEAHPETTQHD